MLVGSFNCFMRITLVDTYDLMKMTSKAAVCRMCLRNYAGLFDKKRIQALSTTRVIFIGGAPMPWNLLLTRGTRA